MMLPILFFALVTAGVALSCCINPNHTLRMISLLLWTAGHFCILAVGCQSPILLACVLYHDLLQLFMMAEDILDVTDKIRDPWEDHNERMTRIVAAILFFLSAIRDACILSSRVRTSMFFLIE